MLKQTMLLKIKSGNSVMITELRHEKHNLKQNWQRGLVITDDEWTKIPEECLSDSVKLDNYSYYIQYS